MFDRRYTAIFSGAILTAAAATIAVSRMIAAAGTPQREPTHSVVVTTRDVPAGVPVPREALSLVPWPARIAPAESFAVIDSVAGRVTRAPLRSGEPVFGAGLAARGAAPGLEGAIEPNRRAMAVRVNEAAGVSGLVRPNSRVDVLMTVRDATGALSTQARVVVSDIRVLGVGPARPPEGVPEGAPLPANVASIVTLEVSPEQARQLAAAESQGAIQVVLRGFGSIDAPAQGGDAVAGAGSAAAAPGAVLVEGGAPPRGMVTAGMGMEAARRVAAAPKASPRAPAHEALAALRHEVAGATPPGGVRPDSGRGETTVVRVYRGGQLNLLTVERADTVARQAAAARGGESSLRTASRAP